MTTIKSVYIVAQTRVLDGFWYASAKNKCFLSKKEALAYCKKENDTQLAKINSHLKDAAINAEIENQRLKAVLDKLTSEEKEVLLYDFGVDYADTEYQPVKNLDYELSVIEFKVE